MYVCQAVSVCEHATVDVYIWVCSQASLCEHTTTLCMCAARVHHTMCVCVCMCVCECSIDTEGSRGQGEKITLQSLQ